MPPRRSVLTFLYDANGAESVELNFDQENVGIILKAMLLQADDREWAALEAQHAKCAPLVRRYGEPQHLDGLAALERRMEYRLE